MMQNSILKTILCITLFSPVVHSAQHNHSLSKFPDSVSPALRPKNPSGSPQDFSITPITQPNEFSNAFPQSMLDVLRRDQDSATITSYSNNPSYKAKAVLEDATHEIIAAWLSFVSGKTVWFKSLALKPTKVANEATLVAALKAITKTVRAENPGHPIYCNVTTGITSEACNGICNEACPAQSTNAALRAMSKAGWRPQHHYHRLVKSTSPSTIPTRATPNPILVFRSKKKSSAHKGITVFQNPKDAAYDIFTHPENLPFLSLNRSEITTYINHPKRFTIVAYLESLKKQVAVGAVVYTIPSAGHGKIELVGVQPWAQGRGIASSLLSLVQHRLRAHKNVTTVEINVLADNLKARSCYEKNGFVVESTMAQLRNSNSVSPQPEPIQLPPAAMPVAESLNTPEFCIE